MAASQSRLVAGNARPSSEFADAVNRNSSVARGLDAVSKEKDSVGQSLVLFSSVSLTSVLLLQAEERKGGLGRFLPKNSIQSLTLSCVCSGLRYFFSAR